MDTLQFFIFGAIGILILYLFLKLLKLPLQILINGIVGVILLYIVNIFGSSFGFTIDINIWTALIAGIFGIPGVVVLGILQFFM